MYVLLFCASPIRTIREDVARVSRDHGLAEVLPYLFQGELTSYRRTLLERDVRRALRRRRPFHLEILTMPDGHFLQRVKDVRR